MLVDDTFQLQLLFLIFLADRWFWEPGELGDGFAEVVVVAGDLEFLAFEDLVETGLLLLQLFLLASEEDLDGCIFVGDGDLGGPDWAHLMVGLYLKFWLFGLVLVQLALLEVLALHWVDYQWNNITILQGKYIDHPNSQQVWLVLIFAIFWGPNGIIDICVKAKSINDDNIWGESRGCWLHSSPHPFLKGLERCSCKDRLKQLFSIPNPWSSSKPARSDFSCMPPLLSWRQPVYLTKRKGSSIWSLCHRVFPLLVLSFYIIRIIQPFHKSRV